MTAVPIRRRRRTDQTTPCDNTHCSAPATGIVHAEPGSKGPREWRHCPDHVPWIVVVRELVRRSTP